MRVLKAGELHIFPALGRICLRSGCSGWGAGAGVMDHPVDLQAQTPALPLPQPAHQGAHSTHSNRHYTLNAACSLCQWQHACALMYQPDSTDEEINLSGLV